MVIELAKTQRIRPGKLPRLRFEKGTYLYIGKAHWHIDFLLNRAHINEIWIKENFFQKNLVPQIAAAPVTLSTFLTVRIS